MNNYPDVSVELEALQKEGVQDPIRFVEERVSGARLLETHFVTEEYVEEVREQVSRSVSAQMWINLKVCLLSFCSAPQSF